MTLKIHLDNKNTTLSTSLMRLLGFCLGLLSQSILADVSEVKTSTDLAAVVSNEALLIRPQTAEEIEVHLQVIKPSNGEVLARVLWISSEYGVLESEKALAKQLAAYGVESWFVDFYEALFLAPTVSALQQIKPQWLATLFNEWYGKHQPSQQSNFPHWVLSANQGAKLALQAVVLGASGPQSPHADLSTQREINHLGLVLLNPNLYIQTPQPGQSAEYVDITSQIDLPITILQAELSPWKWHVNELISQLSSGGSDVFVNVLPQVRDRFYFRADALEVEKELTAELAPKLIQLMQLQQTYMAESRFSNLINQEVPTPKLAPNSESLAKTQSSNRLQVYVGPQNLSLNLPGLNGELINLQDYRGKVVLVNFWASWCPPCVHEIPSMNRLKKRFEGQEFEILAVNLGESRASVKQFADDFKMTFPVLLDESGKAVKDWQVFAYPSSYLLDKNGHIKAALFGAVEWDNPEFADEINRLLDE